jgi:hypothetical protein
VLLLSLICSYDAMKIMILVLVLTIRCILNRNSDWVKYAELAQERSETKKMTFFVVDDKIDETGQTEG